MGSSSSGGAAARPEKTTIGFIVKQPQIPWFQLERKFADPTASEFGFTLKKNGAPDSASVRSAIDNLGASGAKGFVICTPEVRLGPAIMARAKENSLKVFALDDRFLNRDDKPMEEVRHRGISARKIGEFVGQSLHAEFQARQWPLLEMGVCVVTFEDLDTASERTDGAPPPSPRLPTSLFELRRTGRALARGEHASR